MRVLGQFLQSFAHQCDGFTVTGDIFLVKTQQKILLASPGIQEFARNAIDVILSAMASSDAVFAFCRCRSAVNNTTATTAKIIKAAKPISDI